MNGGNFPPRCRPNYIQYGLDNSQAVTGFDKCFNLFAMNVPISKLRKKKFTISNGRCRHYVSLNLWRCWMFWITTATLLLTSFSDVFFFLASLFMRGTFVNISSINFSVSLEMFLSLSLFLSVLEYFVAFDFFNLFTKHYNSHWFLQMFFWYNFHKFGIYFMLPN